jgi:hypothetical protein
MQEATMAHEITEVGAVNGEPTLEGLHSIFAVIFIAFLLLALVSLLFAQNWRTLLPGAESARSVFDGVKSAVYTVMSQVI